MLKSSKEGQTHTHRHTHQHTLTYTDREIKFGRPFTLDGRGLLEIYFLASSSAFKNYPSFRDLLVRELHNVL